MEDKVEFIVRAFRGRPSAGKRYVCYVGGYLQPADWGSLFNVVYGDTPEEALSKYIVVHGMPDAPLHASVQEILKGIVNHDYQ